MSISENIISIREKKRIKQFEIAEKLNIEPSNYSRLEKRGDKLTIEQLKQIANALGVGINELLDVEVQSTDNERVKESGKRNEELELQREIIKIRDKTISEYNAYFIRYFDFKLSNIMGNLGIYIFVSKKVQFNKVEDVIEKINNEDLGKIFDELIKDSQIDYILSLDLIKEDRIKMKYNSWNMENKFRFTGWQEDIIRYTD